VDARQLTYVNRAGFMLLMNFSKRLRERQGDLVLSGLTPQVKSIFDMLRLGSFVKITANVEQAVRYLQKGEFGTAGPPASESDGELPDASDTQSDLEFDAALQEVEGGQTTESDLERAIETEFDEDIESDLASDVEEEPVLPGDSAPDAALAQPGHPFPVFLLCQQCSANLQVDRPGPYRCPRCGNLFRMEKDGSARFLEVPGPRSIRMELLATTQCARGLIEFVGAIARGLFEDAKDVADFQRAVGVLCKHIRDTACEGDQDQSYQVLLVPAADRLVMEIADNGVRVEPAVIRAEARKLVDSLEIKPRLGGGNFYKLVKKKQDLPETPENGEK
jgi:hypothetical protein